jgi:hypothetical protein
MHHSFVVGLRIAASTALMAALAFAQLGTSTSTYGNGETVYAQTLPTPNSTPGPTNPNVAAAPVTALQQTSDQITSVSQQVTQAAHDPSMPIDAKVQLINNLAAQFNALVAQWQQQLSQISAIPAPASAPAPASTPAPVCNSPVCAPPLSPGSLAGVQGTPTSSPSTGMPAAPVTNPTADQLRAQIAAVSQQIAQVSHDPTLSTQAKTAQLNALGAQFNQLTSQLQQLGG